MPKKYSEALLKRSMQLHEDKIEFHNKEFDKLTSEQKTTTKMMDNLYLDKLKGRITDERV